MNILTDLDLHNNTIYNANIPYKQSRFSAASIDEMNSLTASEGDICYIKGSNYKTIQNCSKLDTIVRLKIDTSVTPTFTTEESFTSYHFS